MTDPTPQPGSPVDTNGPPFAETGVGALMFKGGHAYLEEYVFSLEDGPDHEPSDFERAMLEDFMAGILDDDAMFGPVRQLLDRISVLTAERDEARAKLNRSSISQSGCDGSRGAASATQRLLRLSGFTPFRIVETADYAEVHAANGDGKTAFALTMSPSFFEELNAIAEGGS